MDIPIHLGRAASNQCSGVTLVCPICDPFIEKVFDVRNRSAIFVASIGPTGGPRGYASIAGICTISQIN